MVTVREKEGNGGREGGREREREGGRWITSASTEMGIVESDTGGERR